MTRTLEELVQQATVPLTDAAGQLLGTAFFIAPGLAVSAAHVVHGALERTVFAPDGQGIMRALTVRAKHPETVAPGVEPYPLPDLALLDAAPGQFEDTPCVSLGEVDAPSELLAVGFSKSLDPRSAFAPDVARLKFEAVVPQQGVKVIKVMQAAVDAGMSGAPVLDTAAGTVVGLVKATRGAGKPYGAFVVAISELQNCEHSAWGQSELHHRFNPTWRAVKAGDFGGPDPVAATRALADAVIRDAESRRDILPPGVSADALHQTIWLRHRLSPAAESGPNFRQRWRSERALSGLTVVSGDPGFGKSWLLAYQSSQAARQVLRRLDEGAPVDNCIIPVRLTCTALAGDTDTNDANGLARLMTGATSAGAAADVRDERGYVAVIERALADGRMLVCLDGLDEMPSGQRPRLKKALLALLASNNAILVGTRPSGLTTIDEIAPGNREDFQLVGFTARETVNFVRAWLHDRPQAADSLLRALADGPELAQLAQVPLLLSFLCRLTDRGQQRDYSQTTLSQLHLDVAQHLLSGRWRGDRTPMDAEAQPDPVLRMRLLANVVGSLQDTWRGGTEDIPKADLRAALRAHPDYAAVAATAAVRIAALEVARNPIADATEPVLWEYLYDGILVETADAPLRPTVRFIHPLLREMLLATYVASLPADELFACVDRHRWLDGSWERVIVASASLVAAPAALVAHILSDAGDPWVTQRTLAAQVIAAVPGHQNDATAQALLDAIMDGTVSPIAFERRRALAALGHLLRSSSRVPRAWAHSRLRTIAEASIALTDDEAEEGQTPGRGNIDAAIDLEVVASLLAVRDAAAVGPARTMLAFGSYPQHSRARLIAGLVGLNTRESIDVVLGLLTRAGSQQDLTSFLSALAAHADLAVAAAIQLLGTRQIVTPARVLIGRALLECGQLGVDAVRSVADDRTMDWGIRDRLYAELLRAAVPDVIGPALNLLASPYAPYQDHAELALALIEDGVTDAIPQAALYLSTAAVAWWTREGLARAFARQGREGRDLLVVQLENSGLELAVKVRHISALVEVRDQRGIDAAFRLHSDRGVPAWIRLRMAEILMRHDAGLAEENALIEIATADSEAAESPMELVIEMIRQSLPAAEMVLMSLIRSRADGTIDSFSWPDAFMRIAESGEAGRRCLERIAKTSDVAWALRCEAVLALGKTLGGIPTSAPIEDVVADMPELWHHRLVLGMAKVGIAPDIDAFEDIARRLKGGYRIIHEFLLRAPVDWADASRLLLTARLLQSQGMAPPEDVSTQETPPEGSRVVLNKETLAELGVQSHSAFEGREQLQWIYDTLELRVGTQLADLMLQEQLEEFEAIAKDEDRVAALDFLETSFPEYRAIVDQTFAELKAQIKDGRIALPRFIEDPQGTGVLRSVSKIAGVLAEWMGHAAARRWDRWLAFMEGNAAIIGSDLARKVLTLGVRADSTWGLHQAMFWVADCVGREALDIDLLQDHEALHDWLKGRFEQDDFTSLYYGGAFGSQRFPEHDFAWLYVAVAALQQDSNGLALRVVRQAGETRPPSEREAGTAILEHFQAKLGWPTERVEELRAAYIEGVRGMSIASYQRAIEADPQVAQSHFNLGIALQQAGQPEEAVDAYRRATELEPNVAARHRALASALDATGRYEEALEAIGTALTLDQADAGSHTTHGIILDKLGRGSEAVLAFREASRLDPSNHVYLANLGTVLYRLGRYDEAVAPIRQAVDRKPQDATRRAMLATSLGRLGRSDEALHEIDRALEFNPTDASLCAHRGYILSLSDRHQDAIGAYTQSLQLAPDNLQIMGNLAFEYWRLGSFNDAVELGLQATVRCPQTADSYCMYSDALRYAGRLDEAANIAAKGLELAPDNVHLLNGAALAYCAQGRYADSADVLARAAQIAPDDAATRGNLGIALLLSGRREDAISEFREAVRLGPNCPTETETLLAVAVHPADPDESRALAQQALTHGPERTITPFRHAELRAIALLVAGDPAGALAELRNARPLRRPEDSFEEPLYDQLRDIAPEHVDELLSQWPC